MKSSLKNRFINKYIIRLCMLIYIIAILTGCGKSDQIVGEAMDQIQKGNNEEALEILSTLDGSRIEGETLQQIRRAGGIALMGLGRYEEAIGYFEESLAASNGIILFSNIETDTVKYLSAAQYKAGRYEDALNTLDALLAINDKEASVYLLRGDVLLALERSDEASSDYEKAIKLKAKDPDYYIHIYEAFKEYGDVELAQEYLDRMSRFEDRLSNFQKGKLKYYQGDYEHARDLLEKNRSNDNPDEIMYLGMTYEALGSYTFAASLYKTCLEKHPQNGAMFNRMAICLIKEGKYAEALEAADGGIASEDGSCMSELRFNRIVALEYLGRFGEASAEMADYMRMYPGDEEAEREYMFLRTR